MKIKIDYDYESGYYIDDSPYSVEIEIDDKLWKEYETISKIKDRLEDYIGNLYEQYKNLKLMKERSEYKPVEKSTIVVDWDSNEEIGRSSIFKCTICKKEYSTESQAKHCASKDFNKEYSKGINKGEL